MGRDFLIRAYPAEHNKLGKRAFKKPEYCAACHKQFIDKEVNRVGWVQLQNQYDNWAASHWNHKGDVTKTVECRECHMPLVDSHDPAAGDTMDYNRRANDGKHRSHRFIASNQLMPTLLKDKLEGWQEQVNQTEKWLQGKTDIPEISEKWAKGPLVKLALSAPETVPADQPIPIRVILASNKVGHDFPTGPLDIIQSWLEVTVTDGAGKVVFSSGKRDQKNFIEPGSFLFKAELVDQHGNLPPEAPKPRFTNVTAPAGLGDFRTFTGDRTSQLPEDMGCGAAWGDFDNDGLEDLFLVSAGGPLTTPTNQFPTCILYKNLGNGTFRKVAEFPELHIHGMAAAWGDYDNDGFLDLVVSGYNTLLLLHNDGGSGKFTIDPRFANRPGFWSSATWGDYDNDRNLDLYVCAYVDYVQNEADRARISAQLGTAVPYTLNPASYAPGRNLLFHNNGDGTFTEVAEKLGVANPKGRSLGALWHDFDDDGWDDLYIANDISDNAFYRNKGGEFEDLSYSAAVADYRSAMGLAAADWSRKGYDDLFVSHWVGQQDALFHNLWAELPPTNSAAGGKLKLFFMDIADNKGLGQISLPYIGWGTEFFDFDNVDGWQDLAVLSSSGTSAASTSIMSPRCARLLPRNTSAGVWRLPIMTRMAD